MAPPAARDPEPPRRAPLPRRTGLAWVIAGIFALQAVTFYGFNAWLADAYVERGWSETASGGLVAPMNGVTLVGGIGTALVADRIGSRRAFLLVGHRSRLRVPPRSRRPFPVRGRGRSWSASRRASCS